jgi:hypothetical protein
MNPTDAFKSPNYFLRNVNTILTLKNFRREEGYFPIITFYSISWKISFNDFSSKALKTSGFSIIGKCPVFEI